MSVYIYLTVFFILFLFVVFIHIPLDYTLSISESQFEDFINDTDDSMATYALDTRTKARTVWTYWPIWIFLALALWAIFIAQKERG